MNQEDMTGKPWASEITLDSMPFDAYTDADYRNDIAQRKKVS